MKEDIEAKVNDLISKCEKEMEIHVEDLNKLIVRY